MRQSLEQQVQAGQGAEFEAESGKCERLRSENRALLGQSQAIQADNHQLRVDLIKRQEENTHLTKVRKHGFAINTHSYRLCRHYCSGTYIHLCESNTWLT